ncbi:hypothetical protein OROMI_032054 [Orobanche minor]
MERIQIQAMKHKFNFFEKPAIVTTNLEHITGELFLCLYEVKKVYEMLVNDYGFSPDDVLILCDKRRNYIESTMRNIKNSVMKMVQNALGGDDLFLYVTRHGRSGSGRPPAIVTTDLEHIKDEFWSQIMSKVPLKVTLSAIINTCHSGAFCNDAGKKSENSGQVIVLTACSREETYLDGVFFEHGLCPAAELFESHDHPFKLRDVSQVDALKAQLMEFYGKNLVASRDMSSIINSHHFDRLAKLMEDEKVSGKIVCGGQHDKTNLKIAPTILLDVPEDSLIMNEEIFGPLLPIITVNKIEECFRVINVKEKPLAAYVFTND